MTDLRTELSTKWREAMLARRSDHEWRGIALALTAPVRFVAAIREPDERIALILEAPLAAAPSSTFRINAEGLSVSDHRRPEEGIFRLAVVLERDELRDVFEVLAADIVNVVTPSATAPAAIAASIQRLEAWRACLKARRSGLSAEEQLGLLGELIVLRILAVEIGYADAVEAWQGPLQGIHDFSRLGVAIEVKTTLGIGNLLRISHFDQLESIGLSALAIARPRLREDRNGKSLAGTVAEIRGEIGHSAPLVLPAFVERLMRAGYLDVDAEGNDAALFALHEIYGFHVTDGFPRLIASTVPAGIVDGSYTIDERSISGFRMDIVGLQSVMQGMTRENQ